MKTNEKIKNEIIKNFGVAYKAFGLSKLMGHIVALLIYSQEPISLEDIAKNLHRSKGPVSQILRRLRDRGLIRRVWQPTSRKDFYEIQPEVFEIAYRNNLELIRSNNRLAKQLKNTVEKEKSADYEILKLRLSEMEKFYELMESYHEDFLKAWSKERAKIYK
ncbi:MAG: MarR family transcriptional regulator [Ignavibacteriales bacterium]|jgi:DNA-binding transcriptional regulator GbsR (MarR family)|nr:MarR family transcriptional regulator [Ignavibacteriales bacterium]